MLRSTTRMRNQLAQLLGMVVVLGLLLALTTTLAVAAVPQLGIPGPNGMVIGLDDLLRRPAPATLDPRTCFAIGAEQGCRSTTESSSASSGLRHCASRTDAALSKLASPNRIGFRAP